MVKLGARNLYWEMNNARNTNYFTKFLQTADVVSNY